MPTPEEIANLKADGDGDPSEVVDQGGQGSGEDAGNQGGEGSGSEGTASGSTDGEEKDEKGVPLKNRLAEAERKREKAEREAAEATARAEMAERMAAQARPAATPQPVVESAPLNERLLTEPDKVLGEVRASSTAEAAKLVEWRIEQKRVFKELSEEFPELDNKDDEFTREVRAEYQAKKDYHGLRPGQEDAFLLRDAVDRIDRKRLKKKAKSADPAPPFAESGSGGRGGVRRKKEPTAEQWKIGRALKLSDKEIIETYSAMPDEMEVG